LEIQFGGKIDGTNATVREIETEIDSYFCIYSTEHTTDSML